jgi:hypothetical protein
VRSAETGEQLQKLYNLYYPPWNYGYDGAKPVAIARLDDQNGNGSSELAVLARVWGYRNSIAVITRDVQSGDHLSYDAGTGEEMTSFTRIGQPVGLVSLADATGDGQAELAVLGFVGTGYKLQLREAIDGTLVASRRVFAVDWDPRHVRALGDVDGNGAAEIAVAALRPNGRIVVDVRDGMAQTLTSRTHFLSAGFDPHDLEVLPDESGNGVEELAVLGRNPQTGDLRIQIRDAATGEHVRTIQRP